MHYLDLQLRDSATASDIQTALLTAVHAINSDSTESPRLTIAFPGWKDAQFSSGRCVAEGGTGSTFRIFGQPAQLELVFKSPRVQLAMTCALLTAEPVKPVPSDTSWVRFVRERAKDRRSSPSALRRLQRRAASRGEVRGMDLLPRMPTERAYQKIAYQSASTEQAFEFRIACDSDDTVQAWAQSFSTYGLATGAGGVPSF